MSQSNTNNMHQNDLNSKFKTIAIYNNKEESEVQHGEFVKCNFCNLKNTFGYFNPEHAVFQYCTDNAEKKKYFNPKLYIYPNAIFKLMHPTLKGHVVLKEVQRHPVTQKILHIDAYLVGHEYNPKGEIDIMMPLNYVGMEASTYIKQGALLQKSRFIRVKVAVDNLVPYLNVDVSKMKPDTNLMQRDIPLPTGIRLVRKDNINVCTLHKSKGGN